MTVALTTKGKAKTATPKQQAAKSKPAKKHTFGDLWSSAASFDRHTFTVQPIIQPKLKIGDPNDKYEQEADRVADEVMRMSDSEVMDVAGAQPPMRSGTLAIQRMYANRAEGEETLQRKPDLVTSRPIITPGAEAGIQSLEGGGHPLALSKRAFFEPRFGYDFSNVRIHDDSQANLLAASLNAQAFTVSNHIFFAEGKYRRNGASDDLLLSHELTHVSLHSTSDSQPVIRRFLGKKQTVPVDWWIGYEQVIDPNTKDLSTKGHANRLLVVDDFNVFPNDQPEYGAEAIQVVNERGEGIPIPILEDHYHPKGSGGKIVGKVRLVEPSGDTTPDSNHELSYSIGANYDKVRKKTGRNEVIIKFTDDIETVENRLRKEVSMTGASGTTTTVGASLTGGLSWEINLGGEAGVEGTASFEVAPKIIEMLNLEVGGEIDGSSILAIMGFLALGIPQLAAILEGISVLGIADGIKGILKAVGELGYEVALTFGTGLTGQLKAHLENRFGATLSTTLSGTYTQDNSISIASTSELETMQTVEERRKAVPVETEVR